MNINGSEVDVADFVYECHNWIISDDVIESLSLPQMALVIRCRGFRGHYSGITHYNLMKMIASAQRRVITVEDVALIDDLEDAADIGSMGLPRAVSDPSFTGRTQG